MRRHDEFMTYTFDTSSMGAKTWMRIGEALSKCQHLGRAPLKPSLAHELSAFYLARGVQGTTAIEGNTLTTEEVLSVVKRGSAGVPESREYLEREVANIAGAIEEIDQALRRGHRLPIDRDRLCEINLKVLDGIPDEDWVVPGKLRETDVAAGTYKAPRWPEVPDHVEQFVAWLRDLRGDSSAERSVEDRFTSALLSAILAHLYIAWIHPFGNGNGRTARLIEVQILSESGVVPLVSTNLLSDFYNKTRNAYYRALTAAQEDPVHFVNYAVGGFLDELRTQIDEVAQHNLEVQWESFVYAEFGRLPNTDARARQRELALRLPRDRSVTPEDIIDLTPGLARRYALCGERTPARDLNDLAKMGLAIKTDRRHYRGNHKVIQLFIPPVSS